MKRLGALLAAAAAACGAVFAQGDSLDLEAVAKREREQMVLAREQSAEAMQRSDDLERQARAARNEAERLRKQSAALAARIQSAEADIIVGEARVALVNKRLGAHERRLARQRQPLLELTATLQQLSRQPPVSVLAQPGSLSDMIHARAVLDAIIPVIEERTVGVRRELTALRATKQQQSRAIETLAASQKQLKERRTALTRLENQGRLRSRDLMSSARLEADRALGLGEKARDIAELMDTLENDSAVRDQLARLGGPLARPRDPTRDLPASPPLRRVPDAIEASSYRLPVVGRVVAGLGEVSENGVRSRGLTIAVRRGAQLVAPAPGRVSFAGDYRGYGKIIIIDHGGSWTSLVTGLIGLSVTVGDTIEAGTPIGRAGSPDNQVTIELRRSGQPVDIAAVLG